MATNEFPFITITIIITVMHDRGFVALLQILAQILTQ